MQAFAGGFDLGDRAGLANFVDQEGGDVLFGTRQIPNELQQTNDLGDSQRPATIFGIVFELFTDLVNVGTFLVGEVALDLLKHLVQRDQFTDRLLGHRSSIRHKHFIGLLDDRSVAATVMTRCARLKSNAGHDADAQFDVVLGVG